ncbi:hypothetical protein EDB84DRAFT_1557744 [Lactarius hengduanensis]|nr:hypothetical protein EDB84DRAFT_1557744 [Lactarius hengduanensis]
MPETPETHQNATPRAPGKMPPTTLAPQRPNPDQHPTPMPHPIPSKAPPGLQPPKRRRTQTQNNREQNQTQEREMEIDVKGTNWFDQTPARLRGEPQENELDNANPQPEENTVEIDEQENTKTLARIMAASDNSPELNNGTPFLNPLDRYTKGPMPEIHDKDPATLLKGIDKSQIGKWLVATTGKVLARPFDDVANYQPNHKNITKILMAAAKEITGAANAAVAPPTKEKERANQRQCKCHPITFLIHSISKRDVETLLERKVWLSKDITFQVAPINISCPKFLFTLSGLATQDETHIVPILAATWNDPVTCTFLHKLASKAPEPEQNNTMSNLVKFLDVTFLPGRINPTWIRDRFAEV